MTWMKLSSTHCYNLLQEFRTVLLQERFSLSEKDVFLLECVFITNQLMKCRRLSLSVRSILFQLMPVKRQPELPFLDQEQELIVLTNGCFEHLFRCVVLVREVQRHLKVLLYFLTTAVKVHDIQSETEIWI